MCDPVSATAALLLVGSAGANYLGNKAVERKQNSYQGWENARQAGFQNQIMDTVGKETNKFSGPQFTQDLAAKRQGLTDAFTNAISQNQQFLPGAGVLAQPKVVADDAATKLDKSNAFTGDQANARAVLESLGSLMSDRNIDLAHSSAKTRTIGNFMQGSASILPLEMDAASHAGDKHRMVADLFQAAGQGMMTGGLGGGGAGNGIPMGAGSAKPMSAATAKAKGISWY